MNSVIWDVFSAYYTYKTKLRLIRRLGVGIFLNWGIAKNKLNEVLIRLICFDLICFDLIWLDLQNVEVFDITWQIPYPYAWTLNFGNCIDLQLTTHQPPRNFSSCSLEPQVYRILKWWNGEFPYWIRNHFLRVRDLNFSLGKSGRFRTSGSTFWSRSTGGRFDRFRSGT